MIDLLQVARSYEFFYRRLYSNEKYVFSYSESSQKISQKFLLHLTKKYKGTVGVDYLLKYTIFQFSYWKDLELKEYNKRIVFSYIFGPKAIERFDNRNTEFDYQILDQLLQVKSKFQKHLQYIVDKGERGNRDPLKLKYLNTEKGLSNCLLLTTLFDSKDLSCQVCQFSQECKKLLEVNYPQLYKNRGYVSRTQTVIR